MWEREKLSLNRDFESISANVLEAKHALDNLYYNQKLEEEYSEAFTDICTAVDALMTARVDFENLRDKVMKNNV
ncbi:MAG: hypothetical protein CBE47_01725 [Pelagibacteraceae bacterium TMED287]|nr:MAG: hypothetical protein CBE47_01725 [Pelagibacteraceae bacterium TMED287]|tara:strand:- start:616 stop:837 length:222 start_codon:yes stop_codon:yes gene_type:complete